MKREPKCAKLPHLLAIWKQPSFKQGVPHAKKHALSKNYVGKNKKANNLYKKSWISTC